MEQLMHLDDGLRYSLGYRVPVALPKHSCCTWIIPQSFESVSARESLTSCSCSCSGALLLPPPPAAMTTADVGGLSIISWGSAAAFGLRLCWNGILLVVRNEANLSASLLVIRPHWWAAMGSTPAPLRTTSCWVEAGATWIWSSSQAKQICSQWKSPRICWMICGKHSLISPPILKQGIIWPLIVVSSSSAEVVSRLDINGGGFSKTSSTMVLDVVCCCDVVLLDDAGEIGADAVVGVGSNCRPPDVVTAATLATTEATAAAFFIFCFSRSLRIISPLRWEGAADSVPALVLRLLARVACCCWGCCWSCWGCFGWTCWCCCCCAAAIAIDCWTARIRSYKWLYNRLCCSAAVACMGLTTGGPGAEYKAGLNIAAGVAPWLLDEAWSPGFGSPAAVGTEACLVREASWSSTAAGSKKWFNLSPMSTFGKSPSCKWHPWWRRVASLWYIFIEFSYVMSIPL